MQPRSNLWKEFAASGNVKMETAITIGAHTYAPGSVVSVKRASGQSALSCGNTVSATVQFSIAPVEGVDIPRMSAAVVKCRFNDGERVSEWLTVGTFYVTRRQNNPVNGLLEFEGFDIMQKANAPYPSLSGFPKALNSAIMEIARNMGAEVDERTWANVPTGGAYFVPLPADGEKMIKVLGYIGGVCGGNWIITPRNKLRLVPFVSASGAASATDKAEIAAIMSGVTVGDALTVTGAEAATGSTRYFAGTDAGGVVSVSSNPYAKQTLVNALLTKYNGLSYVPFEISGAIYDPASEIGDYIVSRSDVAGVICQESARYGPAFRGDLSAPFASETPETERSLSDAISDSAAVTEDLSVRIYKFTNQSAVTVGDSQSAEIINFDYAAGAEQDVIFHAEVKHTTETTETGAAATGWTYADAVITATYYINGKEVETYHPVKTETDGANLLHLTYHFTNGAFNAGNFRASIALSGGSVSIAAGDANAYIIGQGYSGTDDNWIAGDGLIFIGAESYPDKLSYVTGDTLDLTGLVVKAYYADGTETDVTAQCSVSPTDGSALEAGETVVSVSYTEDSVEFRDSFSVYCVGDQYRVLFIDVITPPTKTDYFTGETLNLDGLVVGATQENGHVIVNIKPECAFSPAQGDALTTPGTVTVRTCAKIKQSRRNYRTGKNQRLRVEIT